MTAEIAVMNKSAVALAADSAVTIEAAGGQKIYNTVNKLFALSKYEPLAAMVFGSAQLLQVPVEIVIKSYRAASDDAAFDTVGDAGDDLAAWIEANTDLFPLEARLNSSRDFAASFFTSVKANLLAALDQAVAQKPITDVETIAIFHRVVHGAKQALASQPSEGSISPDEAAAEVDIDTPWFLDAVESVFEELPLGVDEHMALCELLRQLAATAVMGPAATGLVVAGYGRTEVYPRIKHFDISGFFGSRLRYASTLDSIDNNNPAVVKPFAQREMVDTYIEGIAPNLKDLLSNFLDEFTDKIVEGLVAIANAQGPQATQLAGTAKATVGQFMEGLDDYIFENNVLPIVGAVAVLPKEELAEVAESLVNLTSFKRRVSIGEVETVGGPIDVAIISKGDGLIWIKRKHYFEPELNPQFFANYYRQPPKAGDSDG